MKTTINKSRLMQRAWNIYRGNNPYSHSFSASLRRAWEVEKATIERNRPQVRETKESPLHSVVFGASYDAGCMAYYENARTGQYMGD